MFRKSIATLFLASVTSITPLIAEENSKGIYFVGSVGAGKSADIDIDSSIGGGHFGFDAGFSGEVGFGYDFGSLRTELTYSNTVTEISRIQSTPVGVGLKAKSFLLSAAYDFRANKQWQPYIGAGVGTSTIDVINNKTVGSVVVTTGDDNVSTFKVKAGLNYELSKALDVYGELWGQAFDDFTIGSLKFEDCGMSGASLGFRYKL